MLISYEVSGSFKQMEASLRKMLAIDIVKVLQANGQKGVNALSKATPIGSSLAAKSWGYEVSQKGGVYSIVWTNSDVEEGFPVVIMLQYGYGTGTGGYVQGRDFINPAIKPIFDDIANKVWKAVTSS